MSEYYDALASAVANLKPADQAARYAFYDRARKMVIQRLQAADPPMEDGEIRTEMNAFNAAIRQLENDISKPRRAAAAPARQEPAAPPPATPIAPQPAAPAARQAPPKPRATSPAPQPRTAPPAPPVQPPAPRAPVAPSGSLEIPREFVGEAPIQPAPTVRAEARIAPEPEAADEQLFPDMAPEPDAIAPAQDKSLRKLGMVVGVAVVVGILGAGAYMLWGRDTPPRPVARPAAPASAPATLRPATPAPTRVAAREPERPTADADNMPYILRRQLVYYRTTHPPGTLVISKSQNFLYVVRPNSTAMRYTIGMGPDTTDASGLYQISRKENAADGLYLGDTNYRIKQSNAPITIGRPASSPGFQLVRDDYSDLYDNTSPGTRVVVAN